MEPVAFSKHMQETVEDLRKEFSGIFPPDVVVTTTQAVIQRYSSARVVDYVPVLVYREAREYLGQLASNA
jgi:hypothetical protein